MSPTQLKQMMIEVYETNDNYIVLVLAYIFSRPFCETTFVSRFFLVFMKKS